MTLVNENYLKLKAGYLFPEIARRVKEFAGKHPDRSLIRLGIGDVVLALPASAREAMKRAVDELGDPKTFRGYGPEQGYDFLREAIAKADYRDRGAEVDADEIFVSDGSKCDTGNIQELFAGSCRIGVTDPVYPVYVDTNVMAGRTGESDDRGRYGNIVYLPATEKNGFVSEIPDQKIDLVYLCSPNNPTGTVLTREQLAAWVRYATEHRSILLFDAAYESFIRDASLPRSIYEIPGARKVAIEFRSFSKTAGFTGVRCAFTVVPKELIARTASGQSVSLRDLWARRQSTKFNGVSYPVQRAAEALYTPAGRAEIRQLSDYYLANARIIKSGLTQAGLAAYGGDNAPYVWVKTPDGMGSWQFFDWLLEHAGVVGTPGAGFGPSGEGYFRLSAFNFVDRVEEAVTRISAALKAGSAKVRAV